MTDRQAFAIPALLARFDSRFDSAKNLKIRLEFRFDFLKNLGRFFFPIRFLDATVGKPLLLSSNWDVV